MESLSQPSVACVDETTMESSNDLEPDLDELIFLVGGYDGGSWLSALDSYSPTHDVIKTLNPMNSIRSYASVSRLNDEFYVFGGGNGCLWYDTGTLCVCARACARVGGWVRGLLQHIYH